LGFERFDEHEQKVPDLKIFELRKFVELGLDANPNVLELLYTDPEDHLLVTPLGQKLLDNRDLFLSKRCRSSFSGYAMGQMKRINGHYRWLSNPPKAPPKREDFGLLTRDEVPANQLEAARAAVQKQVDEWEWRKLEGVDPSTRIDIKNEFFRRLLDITLWKWDEAHDKLYPAAANKLGFDTNFIQLLERERHYSLALREWNSYLEWQKNRNPARAELEKKYGYDTKHGMHLIRLFRMCKEILTEGVVRVRRPDADELLEIRRGKLHYLDIVKLSEEMDSEIQELAKKSQLPLSPDRAKVSALFEEMLLSSWA
jgi:predicted nucleotidyltransferase